MCVSSTESISFVHFKIKFKMKFFVSAILLIICTIAPFVVYGREFPYRQVCCHGVRECCAEDHLCEVMELREHGKGPSCGKLFRNYFSNFFFLKYYFSIFVDGVSFVCTPDAAIGDFVHINSLQCQGWMMRIFETSHLNKISASKNKMNDELVPIFNLNLICFHFDVIVQ